MLSVNQTMLSDNAFSKSDNDSSESDNASSASDKSKTALSSTFTGGHPENRLVIAGFPSQARSSPGGHGHTTSNTAQLPSSDSPV